jgi:hypothetical protein
VNFVHSRPVGLPTVESEANDNAYRRKRSFVALAAAVMIASAWNEQEQTCRGSCGSESLNRHAQHVRALIAGAVTSHLTACPLAGPHIGPNTSR